MKRKCPGHQFSLILDKFSGMAGRNTSQTRIKPKTKYLGWLISVILLIILVILYLVPFSPNRQKSKTGRENQETKVEIPFRKNGELTFYSPDNRVITKIDIEIAQNENEHMRGLMYRSSIPADAGMLFSYNEPEVRSFWMKNTYIPLDIIFADQENKIVTIQKFTQPLSEASISSLVSAQYVVEVNAGFSDRNKISEGDRIVF
jgi:uncharacterized membrane protein (UPF0127 family)